MPALSRYRQLVSDAVEHSLLSLDELVSDERERALLREMLAPARQLMTSGKRTRAALLYAGYACATEADPAPAIAAGAALELFQASALVHDDIIDDSPTRRGMPAAHVAFATHHAESGWVSSAGSFGIAGAITLGDLLLSHSIAQCARALVSSSRPETLPTFIDMTTEVAYGQYLDVRAENIPFADAIDPIGNALAVLRHKSARYSVETPLVLGAMIGGGSDQLIDSLRAIGLPLGEAFQLRDDYLGIFGEPQVTGKPACGDITEGKRTVLLALTRTMASTDDRQWLEGKIGRALGEDDIARIRAVVVQSGAHARHEDMIAEREDTATRALQEIDAADAGKAFLRELTAELRGRAH